MFPRALRIGRLGGIDLHVDPSWLVIAVLVVWSFAARFSGSGRGLGAVLTMGVLGALGFFASVLAHELAHALEARHRDIEVEGITLFLFGGVTEMSGDARQPRHELAVAAIGPWASLVLAAVLGLVTAGLDEYVPWAVDIALVTGNLAWLNLGLALFNLVPGAPLDGGRVLRAVLWQVLGDRFRAARIASYSGQVVALALVGLAVAVVARDPAGWGSAVWLALVGAFTWFAARAERRQVRVLAVVHGRRARDLVGDRPTVLRADQPIDGLTHADEARPVVDGADEPTIVGVVTTTDLGRVHGSDVVLRSVRDVMLSVEGLPAVDEDAPLVELLRLLQEHPVVTLTRDTRVVHVVDRPTANRLLDELRRGDRTVPGVPS